MKVTDRHGQQKYMSVYEITRSRPWSIIIPSIHWGYESHDQNIGQFMDASLPMVPGVLKQFVFEFGAFLKKQDQSCFESLLHHVWFFEDSYHPLQVHNYSTFVAICGPQHCMDPSWIQTNTPGSTTIQIQINHDNSESPQRWARI